MIKITAEEMKKISDTSCVYTEEEIEKEIRSRAENGCTNARFNIYCIKAVGRVKRLIPKEIILNLEENGFKVKQYLLGSFIKPDAYDDPYYEISWK